MCKRKITLLLLLLITCPAIKITHGRRRKKIIRKFPQEQPTLTQNAPAPFPQAIEPTQPMTQVPLTQVPLTQVPPPLQPIPTPLAEPIKDETDMSLDTSPYTKPPSLKLRGPGATGDTRDERDGGSKLEELPEQAEQEAEKEIYLNFEDADLKTLVNYISQLKKINLVTDPKIAGNKVSLTIRDPLTVDGAWNIFLTLLEMSKFSIVKVGDLHKVIPQKTKLTEPLPTYMGNVSFEDLPDSDLTIRYVTFLNNIPITQIKGLLQSMLSATSQIIDYPDANGLVITDKSFNIKAAMQVIQELDRSDVKQSVTVMKLKQANANDVKALFRGLMQTPSQSPLARLLGRKPDSSVEYFPPTTQIIAEPRTNSLILIGDQKSIKRIEDFVIKYVDTEIKGTKSPIHIYELKHTDVDQVKNILTEVTKSAATTPAARYGGIRGGVKYFKGMKFAMDKENNRLLVASADNQDWKLLKKTISDIDKPQPQVAMETLIVAVQFDDTKELGSQIRNKKHGQLGSNLNVQAAHLTDLVPETSNGENVSILGNLLGKMTFGLGSTVLTFGKIADVWSIVKMLKQQTNTTVLSQPFIVATNMKKATIEVGTTRRIEMQQAIGESTGALGATGYQDADAKLSLNVTPHINLDGIINLDVDIDINEFKEREGAADRPDTETKHLTTNVSVANGQVLVLGGFVKTKVEESNYKSPIASKIPILGWLFKSKRRVVTKEYIFVFMAPTIMKPRATPGSNLYTKMKLHQARSDIEDAIEVGKTNDPIHNWFFNSEGETYAHKIVDFSNAKYQPSSVDILNDPYYRTKPARLEKKEAKMPKEPEEEKVFSVTDSDDDPSIRNGRRPQASAMLSAIPRDTDFASRRFVGPNDPSIQFSRPNGLRKPLPAVARGYGGHGGTNGDGEKTSVLSAKELRREKLKALLTPSGSSASMSRRR